MARIDPQKTPLLAGTPRQGTTFKLLTCTLRVISGPDAGLEASVSGRPVTIGKGETADLVLTDQAVSRLHAVISLEPNGFHVQDLGSTNGTQIDGVPIERAPLRPGARLRIGTSVVEFAPRTRNLVPVLSGEDSLEGLVGSSHSMREVYALIHLVAPTEATAVLRGETGTGKEVAARAIHALSARARGPFVVFDCANVERELLGSGLFGHTRGAFTGAITENKGAFAAAHGGTLFLDEVGELPLDLQARLLGVLQRREVQPLGSTEPRPIDVRVLAATHRDLDQMVQNGTFREDFYFRLVVMSIELPPLRLRREDIPQLADHFLIQLSKGEVCPRLSSEAYDLLMGLPWRGNVRELRNRLERATLLAGGGEIGAAHLVGPDVRAPRAEEFEPPRTPSGALDPASLGLSLRDLERQALEEALKRTGWNKAQAARELGVNVSTVKRKVKDLGLKPPEGEES